jgi:hypothetical protein
MWRSSAPPVGTSVPDVRACSPSQSNGASVVADETVARGDQQRVAADGQTVQWS